MSSGFSVVTEAQAGGDTFPLHALGIVGDLSYASTWGGGCLTADWSLAVPENFSHGALTPGRRVHVYDGVLEVWRGVLLDSERGTPWHMHAAGITSLFDDYAALDGTGASTADPNVALDQAITRGLPAKRLDTLPAPFANTVSTTLSAASVVGANTVTVTSATGFVVGYTISVGTGTLLEARTISAISGTTITVTPPLSVAHASAVAVTVSGFGDPGSLADLLNLTANQSGKRWGVFADGFITQPADPTTPDYIVVAVDTPGGRTVEDYATHLYGRFYSSLTVPATITVTAATSNPATNGTFGRYERIVDLLDLGPVTPTQAQQVLAGMLALVGPRAGFTSAVAVQPGAILSPGGVPVRLSTVRAGKLVRFIGCIPDPAFGEMSYTTSVDVMVGQVDYDTTADVLRLQPIGMVARDLRGLLTVAARPESNSPSIGADL